MLQAPKKSSFYEEILKNHDAIGPELDHSTNFIHLLLYALIMFIIIGQWAS